MASKVCLTEQTEGSMETQKSVKEVQRSAMDYSHGWAASLMFLVELRKKLLMMTAKELQRLYPEVVSSVPISEMNETPVHQFAIYSGLAHFYNALKSVGDSWVEYHKWLAKFECKECGELENLDIDEFGERVLKKLAYMIKMAMELYDVMEEEEKNSDKNPWASKFRDILNRSYSNINGSFCKSPVTPLHLFPHVSSAHGSKTKNKGSKTLEDSEPETQEVKINSVAKPDPAKQEGSGDCSTTCETQQITVSSSNPIPSNYGGSTNSYTIPKMGGNPVPPPSVAASESSPQSPQPKLSMLLPNVSQKPSPPPATKSKPNVSSPPRPPFLPKSLPNVLPVATSPPSSQPPTLLPTMPQNLSVLPPPQPPPSPQSPTLPQNLSVSPPPPPLLMLPPTATETSAPAPPPPTRPSKGSLPTPPPPLPLKNSAAPPPPPPFGGKLGPTKANSKLKRSSFMSNLYRMLKGKVEGSSIDGKPSHGRKTPNGGHAGGKQSMADALAEMTKRSTYFQQIEEDVKKYAATIMVLEKKINSFESKDMAELLKFHQYVEHHLKDLTDETQVLARSKDFPIRKLETLRMAATLHVRLNAIITTLQSWKIVYPLCQLLDRIECYFNKIKVQLDALERNKDEESKKFKSYNIHFDFDILVRIKELIVDVSSDCMELAIKERREANAVVTGENGSKRDARLKTCKKTLWRTFQLAFQVYKFAGGQDDRADRLSKELAREIEMDPPR
ncbi:hypothetical protein NE237_018125 [Protea cynaroides]|uniref:Hydroxyproline-rich glycoprotein family protein n=1 Tax=Protea cynaroides TaxID=273540 RepID=A0A9Q0K9G3_9MAGN|nr:hypothetical protein NE237_018125 [Protea cynaroides]